MKTEIQPCPLGKALGLCEVYPLSPARVRGRQGGGSVEHRHVQPPREARCPDRRRGLPSPDTSCAAVHLHLPGRAPRFSLGTLPRPDTARTAQTLPHIFHLWPQGLARPTDVLCPSPRCFKQSGEQGGHTGALLGARKTPFLDLGGGYQVFIIFFH